MSIGLTVYNWSFSGRRSQWLKYRTSFWNRFLDIEKWKWLFSFSAFIQLAYHYMKLLVNKRVFHSKIILRITPNQHVGCLQEIGTVLKCHTFVENLLKIFMFLFKKLYHLTSLCDTSVYLKSINYVNTVYCTVCRTGRTGIYSRTCSTSSQ